LIRRSSVSAAIGSGPGASENFSAADVPDYYCDANSRQVAESYLKQADAEPGLFLVRPKEVGGSVKQKTKVHQSWALSYVTSKGEIQHLQVEQAKAGGPLNIAANRYPEATTLHQLLVHLFKTGQYKLKGTPHPCHRWYHGDINREETEALLQKNPVDGHFLVRRSTKEENTWVISLYKSGKVFHNKVAMTKDGWVAAVNTSKKHKGLAGLIEFHSTEAKGMQTALSVPCTRSAPYRFED